MREKAVVLRDDTGRTHPITIVDAEHVLVNDVRLTVQSIGDGSFQVSGEGRTLSWTAASGGVVWVFLDGDVFTFERDRRDPRRDTRPGHHGSLAAPMPATVRKIAVAVGETVARGDVLVVLEAMKMELPVRAPAGGRITNISCREGEMVPAGHTLIELES